MLTKTLTGRQVSGALRERRLTQYDIARVTGIAQPTLSQLLTGTLPLDPARKALIERALAELRVDEPVAPQPGEPVFEIRRESGE